MAPSTGEDALASLCSKYLAMPNDPTSEVNLNAASHPQNLSGEFQAILSTLGSGKLDPVLFPSHQSVIELWLSPGGYSAKRSEFLTSPVESPVSDFLSPSLGGSASSIENDAFSSLCSEYLTMFGNPTSEMSLSTISHPSYSSDEQAAQAFFSILRAHLRCPSDAQVDQVVLSVIRACLQNSSDEQASQVILSILRACLLNPSGQQGTQATFSILRACLPHSSDEQTAQATLSTLRASTPGGLGEQAAQAFHILLRLCEPGHTIFHGSNSLEDEATLATLTLLRTGEPNHALIMYQSPLTDCGCHTGDSSAKQGEFSISPIRSPLGGLPYTPCSRDDDFIRTPGSRNDDFPSYFAPPLIADGDYFAAPYPSTSLFDDAGLFEPPSSSDKREATPRSSAVNLDNMYTISPSTPALDASPFVPSPHRSSSGPPTGIRKHTPDTSTPLDAPVRSRNNSLPPATPRRDASLKRSRTEAFGDDEESSKYVAELDTTAFSRLQNTLAARRSRRRKLEHKSELEASLERERQLKEQWRSRAMTLEAVLFSHGIPVPPATIDEPC